MPHPLRRPKLVPAPTRSARERAGRTSIRSTPLQLRVTGVQVKPELESYVYELLGRRLARFGTHIERVAVRFKDVNGPRGGKDILCRILLTISGRPAIVAEERAHDAISALQHAARKVQRAIQHSIGRARLSAPLATTVEPYPEQTPQSDRIKISASASTQNFKGRTRGMKYALEESEGKPSRRSTRKSINRRKSDNSLRKRQTRRAQGSKHSTVRNRNKKIA